MNIFHILQNKKDFTTNEQQIVSFILKSPNDFLKMSIDDIRKECFVSAATVYRLCQKLDMSGLSELKVEISGAINSYLNEDHTFDFDFPVKQNQSNPEILSNIKEDYDQTVLSTYHLFDDQQLSACISAMKKAKQIDIYTSAGNIFFAQNFQFQMKEIGIHVQVPVEEYAQRLCAASSDDTHLAILITFGGRGALVDMIVNALQTNRTPILLISSLEYQPDYANYHLTLCSNENHYHKISSFSTRLSLLYILDILYTCYFEQDYDNHLQKKMTYYEKLVEATGYHLP